jgi:hypothetical protein
MSEVIRRKTDFDPRSSRRRMPLGESVPLFVLALVVCAAVVAIFAQPPFAFYSPDVSYHAARVTRASEGEYFTDPFSGTKTIYPSLFHAVFGTIRRLGLSSFDTMRLATAASIFGMLAGFFRLARVVLPRTADAVSVTLALPLLFIAPSGHGMLIANPVNFSLALLLLGFGCIWRHLYAERPWQWSLGLGLVSFGVNVSWYQALAAVGVMLPALLVLRRQGRLRRGLLLGLLPLALPCLWTAFQLVSTRDVLPRYWNHQDDLVRWTLRPDVLWEWLVVYLTHWNLRFLPRIRDTFGAFHYFGLVVPFTLIIIGSSLALAWRHRKRPHPLRSTPLGAAALLVFVLSLVMAMLGDFARVSCVQFVSFAFVLLFLATALFEELPPPRVRWLGRVVAAGGVVALTYTVTQSRKIPELRRTTQVVIDFIAALPDHRHTRIFVSDAYLRRLVPFVPFESFVNHRSGRYYSQDPVSSAEMLSAYEAIVDRDPSATDELARYGVRFLVFHPQGHGREKEAELADAYGSLGRVVLHNREWVMIERGRF